MLTRIVDNRVFLLGLDKLYRESMKQHERTELLACARRVARVLQVKPARVPVEGYYSEDRRLTKYFRLLRALQQVDGGQTARVESLQEFRRLREVTSAPLYGQPSPRYGDRLLPTGCDALTEALDVTWPWTVPELVRVSRIKAEETDDISLVGLAARIEEPLVLTALRESVVLYAEKYLVVGIPGPVERVQYVWNVNDDLAELATRFVDAFNSLFGERLPTPEASQAELYWHAQKDNVILGRCTNVGIDETGEPIRYYHWAICEGDAGLTVQEFWDKGIWTTSRYRGVLGPGNGCPDL